MCFKWAQKPPKTTSRARLLWILRHRIARLSAHADAVRGTGINMNWLFYAGQIMDCYDAAGVMGIDIETPEEEWR